MTDRIPLLTRLFGPARIHRTVTAGSWTKIGRGAVIGERVRLGSWSKIGNGVTLAERVRLGDWSHVGDGSRIGPDTEFGSWARVGKEVTIGARVRLGSHTRVQDGVTIPNDAIFDDCDLVTPEGVIPNRTGGYSCSLNPHAAVVSSPFGVFVVPLEYRSQDDDMVEQMIDDHQWGRSDALEPCRCSQAPGPEEMEAVLQEVRSRQKLHQLGLWSLIPEGHVEMNEPDLDLPDP